MASEDSPAAPAPAAAAGDGQAGITPPPAAPPSTVAPADHGLEAEADDYDGHDSSFEGSVASSTTSIGSSILKHREENGRRYHAYKEGKYILPNDELENDRLDLQHHLLYLTQEGKLFLAPIPKEKTLHNVLDAGTGTGIWAIDFADEHPESQVVGVDLSPIQPNFLPPNCRFEIDDLEEPWTYSQKFDFIYSRMMCGSLADWPKFFAQSFENLTPGGYVELCDGIFPLFTDDNSYPPNSALEKWGKLIVTAAAALGRSADSALLYQTQMEAVGFVDIVEKRYKWPSNGWPKDKKIKELGLWNYANMGESVSGISMALFTRGLGWSVEELELFLVDVRKEMKNTKIHAYWDIRVIYGRKPE